MTGAVLLLASLLGLAAGAALGATALGLRGALDWLLGALVLACVEATAITVAAGAILDRYEPWTILFGVIAWAIVLAVVCAARSVRWSGARAAHLSARHAFAQLAWWQWLIVVVAAVALAWRVVLAVVLPPFAFDALVYHLTIVADWVKSGQVGPNPYVMCCSHYPSGAETLYAWPALFLDNDVLVDVVQTPLALMAALAVMGLARWIGATPTSALTAGALFLLTPIVLTQANTPYNDVGLAAFLLTATYFVTRMLDARCFLLGRGRDRPSAAFALLAGSATGLALGTKTSGIAIAVVLTMLVVAHLAVAASRRSETRRSALRLGATFVAAALVVGGWWYARSWSETGNPIWPFEVSPAGIEVFSGPETIESYLTVPPGAERSWPVEIARSWYRDLTFWTRSDYSYEERDGGLGPLWSWLGWAAVVALAAEAVRRRRDVAVNLLVPLLVLFLALPYKWWSRFTIFVAALGAIAIVGLVDRARPGWRRNALTVAVLVLACAGVARASWYLDPAGRGSKLAVPDVLELAVHPWRQRTVGDLFFPEYGFLSSIPATASVVVETDAPSIRFPYPFFGPSLDRTVTLLREGDERRLARLVAESRAEYAVVGAESPFDTWFAARRAQFTRVFSEHDVRVYRRTA